MTQPFREVYPSPGAGGWWCARAVPMVFDEEKSGDGFWLFTPDDDRVATVWGRGDEPDHARRYARLIVDALNAGRPAAFIPPEPEPDRRS